MPPNTQSGKLLADVLMSEGPLDAERVASVARQLAAQLAQLHEAGRLHGQIGVDMIAVENASVVRLVEPAEEELTVWDADRWPPELPGEPPESLPRSIEAARVMLRSRGIDADPRRIDLYQFGGALCQLLSGAGPRDYLYSPRSKARIPAPWRGLVDRLLGLDPARRITTCAELAVELDRICRPSPHSADAATPPHGTGKDVLAATPREPHSPAAPLHASKSAAPPLPFAELGHYHVVARLGSGGMGDVYEGYEPTLDRRVALKVLPPELARQPDFVDRFTEEAKAAARLVHPNIVQIYFIGADRGHHFFAMQYVPGETLAARLSREGRLSLNETLAVIEQVLAGLSVAHRQGFIHRDIKPGNILLDNEHHRALLADFGLVKSLGSSAQMTATGMVMGTVDYISPEQGRGKPVDGRSDLYSIGVLMYQLLSGRLPFAAESATAMIFQHAYERPRPLAEVVPGIPAGAAAIIHRLLAKEPADRYQSAEELLADIRALRASPDFEPVHRTQPPAAGTATDKSVIITAPDFEFADEERRLTAALANLPQARWHDRLRVLFNEHAPEALRNLQNTQQQVSGALAVYQSRRDKLAQLAHEARAVERDLADQGLMVLASEQRAQREDIEFQLAKVDATLLKLRNQQAVFNARLRAADAGRVAYDTQRQHGQMPRQLQTILLVSLLAGPLLVVVLVGLVYFETASPPTAPTEIPPPPVAEKFDLPPAIRPNDLSQWSTPVNAGSVINSQWNDGGLFVARNGLSMLLHSMRADDARNDLWTSERKTLSDKWPAPRSLGPEVNGASWDESPTTTADGLLLVFDSERPDGFGARDIYMATRDSTNRPWTNVVNLGPSINSLAKDFAPSVSPDGLTLYFSSYRLGGTGGSDLYVARRAARNLPWAEASNLGSAINSKYDDSSPFASADGRELVFSSNRPGGFGQSDLWIALKSDSTEDFAAPTNLGPNVNSSSADTNPRFLPRDDELAFASNRPGGQGGFDIWFSHRNYRERFGAPPQAGTWQVNFPAGAQRAIFLLQLADEQFLIRGTGNLDGVYRWDGQRLVVEKPSDARFVNLLWGWVGKDLVLIDEPPNHPAGANYLGTRLRFISEDTTQEARTLVPTLPTRRPAEAEAPE